MIERNLALRPVSDEADVRSCFRLVRQLRPNLTSSGPGRRFSAETIATMTSGVVLFFYMSSAGNTAMRIVSNAGAQS